MKAPQLLPLTAALMLLATAAPAAAQDDAPFLSFRPFVMASGQRFAAETTFDAIFGDNVDPMFGGGLNIVQEGHFYLELSASRWEKTGQRAFLNAGQVFHLGIPVTAKVTQLEGTAGYRFGKGRVRPYLGGGVGLWQYEESSDFATEDENVDTQHAGGIIEGGVEFRLHRWIGVAADAHWTYVPGILGDGGISNDANEKNLGGIAARVKVIIGR
jgi:Outer membrane protein beta-barrel domain